MEIKYHLLAAVAAATTFAYAGPSHAFGLGLLTGVTSAFNQVESGLVGRVTGASNLRDIQAAHDKLYANFDAQTAGMDPAAKRQVATSMDQSWSRVENAILMSNAQAQRQKNAPLLDMKKVALDSMGGLATQVGMNSVLGGGGMGGMMTSSAMSGLVGGLDGSTGSQQTRWVPMASPIGQPSVGGMAADAAGKGAGSWAGNFLKQHTGSGADEEFKFDDDVNPMAFLGKAPRELRAADLYRENGFLGWKRVEKQPNAEAYAPITGPERVKAAIFNFSPKTGEMNAAFRILSIEPVQFNNVVTAMTKQFGEPRYASSGSMVRATWPNGAFATNDMAKIIVGWSARAETSTAASN